MVIQTQGPVDLHWLAANGVGFVVSHGYRHILGEDIVTAFDGRAVNLHISLLPWNRGSDPNFWSFVDGTPRGVSIHYLAMGIDTGDLIVQHELAGATPAGATLASTYQHLQDAIAELFMEHWVSIRDGTCGRQIQAGEGSYHRLRDKERLARLMPQGWASPVDPLIEYAAESQLAAAFNAGDASGRLPR